MAGLLNKFWNHALSLLPLQGFYFDRPIVVLQSDDWGRVGVRDQQGFEQLRAAGLNLGERPYDFYTLETAEDLNALSNLLKRHRDSTGRPASLVMNFVTANLDFSKMDGFRQIELLPLADGLPQGWVRPGLFEAYRAGVAAGVFYPAVHGTTHFCRPAVERQLADSGERGRLLRNLWNAGTPYIHWRMPWIGYEYWDPGQSETERFLSAESQTQMIGSAVGYFAKLFSSVPRSACAPGYRADSNTNRAWTQFGIKVAQNGAGVLLPPHFENDELLQLYRNVLMEPAITENFSLTRCLDAAAHSISLKIPVVVSVHSINFHSSLKEFRSRTLAVLDEFLSALEHTYPDLLYLNDEDVWQVVQTGAYQTDSGIERVTVTKKRTKRSGLAKGAGE